jgi:hypothetical protein
MDMKEGKSLVSFETQQIRRVYDEASEIWFFSVVDVVAALIQQLDYQAARNYWKVLKERLKLDRAREYRNFEGEGSRISRIARIFNPFIHEISVDL